MEKLRRSCGDYRYRRLETNVASSGPFSGFFGRMLFCCAFLVMAVYCLWTYLVIKPYKLSTGEDYQFETKQSSLVTKKPQVVKKQYFIETESCKIPYVDAYEKNAMKLLTSLHIKDCDNRDTSKIPKEIVKIEFDQNTQRYQLRIMYPLINNSSATSQLPVAVVDCCFREITHSLNNSKSM